MVALGLVAGLIATPSVPATAMIWSLTKASASSDPSTSQALARQRAAEARIATRLATLTASGPLHGAASVNVVDVASGAVIYGRKKSTARTAASNTKLYTAVAALQALGPSTRFTTTITRAGTSNRVTFVSAGDPRMTNARLRSLARQTATRLKASSTTKAITVRLDDSLFAGATKSSTWRQGGYGLSTIQPVRATARTAVRSKDSAASAATAYARYLDAALGKGWSVTFRGRAATPPTAVTIAKSDSATVKTLVKRMLNVSDNQVAEVLHRHIALSQGLAPTFAGGAKATLRVVSALGVDTSGITLVDGSGLSPRDRITPKSLTSLLTVAANPENSRLRSILYADSSLPVAGKTGTLKKAYARFTGKHSKCAAGKVVAKTGSLDYEVALSGYTVGADGRLKAFSVIVNGLHGSAAKTKARASMDQLAATVNGCA